MSGDDNDMEIFTLSLRDMAALEAALRATEAIFGERAVRLAERIDAARSHGALRLLAEDAWLVRAAVAVVVILADDLGRRDVASKAARSLSRTLALEPGEFDAARCLIARHIATELQA